jgi:hypothetical protein
MGKQPVLLQLRKNYRASATDMQSANKTGEIIFITSGSKSDEEQSSCLLNHEQNCKYFFMGFEVLASVLMNVAIFWDIAPHSPYVI